MAQTHKSSISKKFLINKNKLIFNDLIVASIDASHIPETLSKKDISPTEAIQEIDNTIQKLNSAWKQIKSSTSIPKKPTLKKKFSEKWKGKFLSNKTLPNDPRLDYLLKKHT